jgi:hypothetical protein
MIHSFTVAFGAKYLTGIVTSVPPGYETFSFIGVGNQSSPLKTTDLPQVTDKLYHIMLYQVHLAMNKV